ncbi:hypothetical protein KJZ61_02375 [Candidatus Dependentiae bacterium]|nr:hypothetical protein [Candidatus Dependentiae bacterium]
MKNSLKIIAITGVSILLSLYQPVSSQNVFELGKDRLDTTKEKFEEGAEKAKKGAEEVFEGVGVAIEGLGTIHNGIFTPTAELMIQVGRLLDNNIGQFKQLVQQELNFLHPENQKQRLLQVIETMTTPDLKPLHAWCPFVDTNGKLLQVPFVPVPGAFIAASIFEAIKLNARPLTPLEMLFLIAKANTDRSGLITFFDPIFKPLLQRIAIEVTTDTKDIIRINVGDLLSNVLKIDAIDAGNAVRELQIALNTNNTARLQDVLYKYFGLEFIRRRMLPPMRYTTLPYQGPELPQELQPLQ